MWTAHSESVPIRRPLFDAILTVLDHSGPSLPNIPPKSEYFSKVWVDDHRFEVTFNRNTAPYWNHKRYLDGR